MYLGRMRQIKVRQNTVLLFIHPKGHFTVIWNLQYRKPTHRHSQSQGSCGAISWYATARTPLLREISGLTTFLPSLLTQSESFSRGGGVELAPRGLRAKVPLFRERGAHDCPHQCARIDLAPSIGSDEAKGGKLPSAACLPENPAETDLAPADVVLRQRVINYPRRVISA